MLLENDAEEEEMKRVMEANTKQLLTKRKVGVS